MIPPLPPTFSTKRYVPIDGIRRKTNTQIAIQNLSHIRRMGSSLVKLIGRPIA